MILDVSLNYYYWLITINNVVLIIVVDSNIGEFGLLIICLLEILKIINE